MRVDPAMVEAATQAVRRAADATGADFSLLLATAKRESGFNGDARAATSSASGLFQFIESTWMEMIKRYGPKHGVTLDANDPRQRQSILALRFDPDLSARMAGELTRENASVLEAKIGRTPSAGELYAAHVLGPDGASKLINASGDQSAAAILPKAAGANRAIFYKDGAARTPEQVLAKLDLDQTASSSGAEPKRASPIAHLVNAIDTPIDWAKDVTGDLWALAMRAYGRERDEEDR